MKKIILVVAVLAMSVSAAMAQGFEWGAKAGLNLANLTEMDDTKMRPGFYAGVFAEKVVSDFFGVQGELLYSQMGAKYDFDGDKFTTKMDYLTLPVLAKLYVFEGLSVDLGPQFGYMLSAKEEDESFYDADGLNKFDVSFAMGLSYKICGHFDVSARYNLGLTKIQDDVTIENVTIENKMKNGVISLGVGYRF